MEKQFELISFDKDSPFHLTYLNLGEIQGHWHSELEILFVLIGKIAVVVNDRRYILNEEDIIVRLRRTGQGVRNCRYACWSVCHCL